jgi:Zn-dependent protease
MPAECARCRAAVPPDRLDCPACHVLVHAELLKSLSAAADEHARHGRREDAVALWRQMLDKLPAGSRQHAAIGERIATSPGGADRKVGGAATLGALALAASKLKMLVPTILSLGVSFAAFWTAYGWQFAAGLLASIWVHEMGHVVALRAAGIAASPPMFIPGLGAYVRLKQPIPDPHVDARIGLAGPIAGAAAAVACWLVALRAGGVWVGLAQAGALVNLFNLTPFFQLDGGRAFRALTRLERGLVTVTLGGALAVTEVSVLWLPLVGAAVATLRRDAPRDGYPGAAIVMVMLVAGLALLAAATRA